MEKETQIITRRQKHYFVCFSPQRESILRVARISLVDFGFQLHPYPTFRPQKERAPPPFWNRVQVKSYLPPQFHFLSTPFGDMYCRVNREHFFAFRKILNHCTKWWKGVPRGAKKRDQKQKSLGNVRVFLIKSHQQVPWPRQYDHKISMIWFTWLKLQSLRRFGITDPSRRYSKHVSFCISQVDSFWSQTPS